jgi:hypothetical protein
MDRVERYLSGDFRTKEQRISDKATFDAILSAKKEVAKAKVGENKELLKASIKQNVETRESVLAEIAQATGAEDIDHLKYQIDRVMFNSDYAKTFNAKDWMTADPAKLREALIASKDAMLRQYNSDEDLDMSQASVDPLPQSAQQRFNQVKSEFPGLADEELRSIWLRALEANNGDPEQAYEDLVSGG